VHTGACGGDAGRALRIGNQKESKVILRAAKIALVAAVAFSYTLVAFDNLTDYNSNYQFVRHVLMMDTTFPGNHAMGRAIDSSTVHTLFYVSIIAWEISTCLLLWWGVARLVRAMRSSAREFDQAKSISFAGLALSLLMWLVAFLGVGGEWFLMWQSSSWNGETAAARNFVVVGIVFLILQQREREIGF
jgi:predicted small integral membrane protein